MAAVKTDFRMTLSILTPLRRPGEPGHVRAARYREVLRRKAHGGPPWPLMYAISLQLAIFNIRSGPTAATCSR
jgi:hypothetical protein